MAKNQRRDGKSVVYACSSSEAFSNARRNRLRRYPSPEQGGDRLYPLVAPSVKPGFKFGRKDTIFAIGSCFARNIEGALQQAGMAVLSRDVELGKIGDSVGSATNFLNKYTVPSIYNDLKWAIERDSFPGEKVIYPVGKGVYCDPQLGLVRLPFPLADILEMRHRYLDVMARSARADVIIITLGYVETWYDTELGIYLNIAPPPLLCKAQPNRFEFRVLGFEDVRRGLEDIYALLKRHRDKPLKMLVTVSPVPLLSTFRAMDVLVANTYSKSVQRAAVETFVADKADVDYFPSFEFVTLSNPAIAWSRGDYRHVSSELVARIMSNVLTNYVADEDMDLGTDANGPLTRPGVLATARLLEKLGDHGALITLYRQNPETFDQDAEQLLRLAGVFEARSEIGMAIEALSKVVELQPERPVPLQRLINLTASQPDGLAHAKTLLKLFESRFPHRTAFREKIAKTLAGESIAAIDPRMTGR